MLRTRNIDGTALRALSRSGWRLQRAYSTRDADATPDRSPASRNPSTAETRPTDPVPGDTQAQSFCSAPPPIDVEALRSRLKEWGVLTSSSLRQRSDEFSKRATDTFSNLGLHLNRVTGYEQIEALKRQVVEQEARIKATRRAAREAKTAYDDAVLQRSVSQRQVNDLLQRKSSWTDTDVGNFTSLVRSDHSFEQEEARAKARVAETEDAADRAFSELMKVILARYHEEQVWSDKIRSASTYGSLAALGVNVVVFIMAIIVVEPWKRKRLAQTFEKKVEQMGSETNALMNAGAARIEETLAEHEKRLAELVTRASAEARGQGAFAAATVPQETFPEEAPQAVVAQPPSSRWSRWIYFHPQLGVILPGRELMLVAGGAAVGGTITFLMRS